MSPACSFPDYYLVKLNKLISSLIILNEIVNTVNFTVSVCGNCINFDRISKRLSLCHTEIDVGNHPNLIYSHRFTFIRVIC